MPWNSTSPNGSISVKANRPFQQQNTTYIETTMGNDPIGTNTVSMKDHFWNVGSDEDGHHRMVASPAFTLGGTPADPVIPTGMDSVSYSKTVNGTVQRFFRNAQGIYQDVPAILTGTVPIPTTSFTNIVAVPANVYGEIFMWALNGGAGSNLVTQVGNFVTDSGQCYSFGLSNDPATVQLSFDGNSLQSTNLLIRARRVEANNTTWNYRITYRAM